MCRFRSLEQIEKRLVRYTESVCGPNEFEREDSKGWWIFASMFLRSALRKWLAKLTANPGETIDKGNTVVLGCPGDFTLMHKDVIMAVRGYPEVALPTRLDDLILIQAVRLGLHCVS